MTSAIRITKHRKRNRTSILFQCEGWVGSFHWCSFSMGLLLHVLSSSDFQVQGQRWFCGLSYAMYGSITFDKLGIRILGHS